MAQTGTTRKQQEEAIRRLTEAGLRAWGVAEGHNALWVACPAAFPERPGAAGRVSVPKVAEFLSKFAPVATQA